MPAELPRCPACLKDGTQEDSDLSAAQDDGGDDHHGQQDQNPFDRSHAKIGELGGLRLEVHAKFLRRNTQVATIISAAVSQGDFSAVPARDVTPTLPARDAALPEMHRPTILQQATTQTHEPSMSTLIEHPRGGYRFLPGIDPYSCGVIAAPEHEIMRVTLRDAIAWREGFEFVDRVLSHLGCQRANLCAMELRSAKPFSMQGFIDFNRQYCSVLESWDVFVDGANPIARTNVCPTTLDAPEPILHAFSFARPSDCDRPTFIVAGAGELRAGTLVSEGIVRRGETSTDAIAEKAEYVCQVMQERLQGLQADWHDVTAVDAYTVHPLEPLMESLLARLPAAQRHGVHWYYTRPPVLEIEYEMDLRGVATELIL